MSDSWGIQKEEVLFHTTTLPGQDYWTRRMCSTIALKSCVTIIAVVWTAHSDIITGSLHSVLDSICVCYYEIKSCGVELELLS